MTALHGNYGFNANGYFPPFADPEKAVYHSCGISPDNMELFEAAAYNICEANRYLIGVVCADDMYFDVVWDMSISCIKANWPHIPDTNFPAEGSTIQKRREWAHSQISEAMLLKELFERQCRKSSTIYNL